MTGVRRTTAWRLVRVAGTAGLVVAASLLAACGGSSGGGGTGNAQPGDVVGYCALSREVSTAGVAPTTTQVTDLIRLAPLEIRGDVTTFLQAGDASDTGVQAFTRILDYESTHC